MREPKVKHIMISNCKLDFTDLPFWKIFGGYQGKSKKWLRRRGKRTIRKMGGIGEMILGTISNYTPMFPLLDDPPTPQYWPVIQSAEWRLQYYNVDSCDARANLFFIDDVEEEPAETKHVKVRFNEKVSARIDGTTINHGN